MAGTPHAPPSAGSIHEELCGCRSHIESVEAVGSTPAGGTASPVQTGSTARASVTASSSPAAIDPGGLALRPVVSPPGETPGCFGLLRRKKSSLLAPQHPQPAAEPVSPSTSQGSGAETSKLVEKKTSRPKIKSLFTGRRGSAEASSARHADRRPGVRHAGWPDMDPARGHADGQASAARHAVHPRRAHQRRRPGRG